jgi:membrane protein
MATVSPIRKPSDTPNAREQHLKPWKLGGLSAREVAKRVWKESNEDEIFDRAAGLSYYFVFALFPALLFLTALLGMLPIPDLMDKLMAYAEQALPEDAASMLSRTLGEIVVGSKASLLSIGALAALWAASGGVVSMMTALSVTYDVEDTRPWWKRRVMAVGLTFALALLILSAMTLLIFGGAIGRFLGNTIGLGDFAVRAWTVAQWPVAVFVVVAAIALIYYAAPNVEQRKWYWVTPGSFLATVAWIAMSVGLRFYVTHFGNYTATYGSIAGMMLLLLWLYLSAPVLLLGAEVNAEIEHAAAARGAATAKAKGEEAPGKAGVPARTSAGPDPDAGVVREQVADLRAKEAAARARAGAPLTPDDLGVVAQHTTEAVARAASGAVIGVRAFPAALAWAGWRLVSRATAQIAGRRRPRDQRPSASRRAA